VIAQQGEDAWKIVAVVDLLCTEADRVVQDALTLGDRLRGEVTLLSVVARDQYERGVRYGWPQNAFGRTCPEVDIHRVVLPGTPAEAVATYADRLRADVIVIPAQYKVRRWLRKQPLAQAIAVLTSIPLWIVPAGASAWAAGAQLRVACVLRLDGTDERLCMAAQSVLHRCGGELVLTCGIAGRNRDTALQALDVLGARFTPPCTAVVIEDCLDEALSTVAVENNFGLIATGRPMCVNGDTNTGQWMSGVNRLPCPVLWVPSSPVSTPTCFATPKSTAAV
jgi:nucleotide-binding universal stress UspA family protein